VDPETWDEEVSIRSLFGHLCSGEDFLHDKYMREMIDDTDSRPHKRARHTSSSFMTSSQQSSMAHQDTDDDEQRSAFGEEHGRIHRERRVDFMTGGDDWVPPTREERMEEIRQIWECLEGMKDQLLFINGPLPPEYRQENRRQKEPELAGQSKQTQQEGDKQNNSQQSSMSISEVGISAADPTSQSYSNDIATNDPESQLSIPSLLLQSQNHDDESSTFEQQHEQQTIIPNTDGPNDDSPSLVGEGATTTTISFLNSHSSTHHLCRSSPPSSSSTSSTALKTRLRAYHAARAGTFDAWSEVSLVSAGNDHTEEEVEL
jgi:DNA cross-link repair 1C protein